MTPEERILKNLYQELEKVKIETKREYDAGKIKIDLAEIEKRINQSQHLIDLRNIEIDEKWLENLFRKYLLILKRFKKEDGKVIEKIEESFEKKELDLGVLVKRVFSYDPDYLQTLAKKLTLEVEDLHFLGLHLGNPIFELYAGKLKKKIDQEKWLKGSCPVCGSSPAMACLRKDDGKRILWCQFCRTGWSFMRLKCPFCSNEDQKTLRYFFTDENDPHRVHVCDKCKRYVKTIDQRKMEKPEELDLHWESVHTLFLDLLARKDGYSNVMAFS